jgi:tryptophan 2,3-dioxygenase
MTADAPLRDEHALTVPGDELTYASYLRVDELLALQTPRSDPPEHDETLFIVIHQVYELWFKQLLHELDRLVASLAAGDTAIAGATFKRMLAILKTLVGQVDVLETMTPVQFSSFRTRLESASGFQSRQFRALELGLGKRDLRLLAHLQKDPTSRALAEGYLARPSLYDAFLAYLARNGVAIPAELLGRDTREPIPESAGLRAALVDVYWTRPELANICERLVDLDEGLQEWRYRHVKMVERTIGLKRGTGGSAGAAYLQATLFKPLYADLWAIRSEL